MAGLTPLVDNGVTSDPYLQAEQPLAHRAEQSLEDYEMEQPLDYKSNGTVTRRSRNRISCSFVVDGYQMTFDATLNPAMAPFTSQTATISYRDVDDLTGTYAYSGYIGQDEFEMTIVDGERAIAIINGVLNNKLNVKNQVQGSGTWMST